MLDSETLHKAAAGMAAAGLLTAPLTAPAFDFHVSGQVNRAAIAADNGEDSDVGFVDNTGANSRFRFTGDQTMDNGMTVGFTYEIGLGENASARFNINDSRGTDTDFLDNRLANVYLEGDFGRLTFGKLHGPGDGTSEADFSGVRDLSGGVVLNDYFGGITFMADEWQGADPKLKPQFRETYQAFDGLARQNGIHYDTPSFGGLVLSAALENDNVYELAARYDTTFADGTKLSVASDFLDTQDLGDERLPTGEVISRGDQFQEWGGSASVLLPSGWNVTAAFKKRRFVEDDGDPDTETYFTSVGYIAGRHHYALSYARNDSLLNEASTLQGVGASYMFAWTEGLELYASYHVFDLSDARRQADIDPDPNSVTAGPPTGPRVDAENLNALLTGVRLKFF